MVTLLKHNANNMLSIKGFAKFTRTRIRLVKYKSIGILLYYLHMHITDTEPVQS